MKKILLYPFDYMSLPILQHSERIKDMEICKIISPRGWGYKGKYNNYDVEYDFYNALSCCDVVWIVNSKNDLSYEEDLKGKITEAINRNKEVIVTRKIDECEINKNEEITSSTRVNEKNICFIDNSPKESLYDINCPVVYIVGTTEDTNRFNILLSLANIFEKKGYRPMLFCDREEGDFLGCYNYSTLLKNDMKEIDRVKTINSFFKKKEIEEKPDIMFVMIPGRLLSANKFYIENTIINAFEISYAIVPDCIILSMMYTERYDQVISKLQKQCERILGYSADYINISSRMLDVYNGESGNEISSVALGESFVKEKMDNFTIEKNRLVFLNDPTSYEILFSKLLNTLCEYNNPEIV